MLLYDQIPPERRTIFGFARRIGSCHAVLSVSLTMWMARDDSGAEPDVRQAANTAMKAIDGMLDELHTLRVRLMDEIRVSDDIAVKRTAALLEQIREDGDGKGGAR